MGLKKSNFQSTVLSIFVFKVTILYVAISKLNRETHVSQPELAGDGCTISVPSFHFVVTLVSSFQSLIKLETGWLKLDFNDRNC